MPHENMKFMPHASLMTKDEIYNIAQTFVSLGVNKIRLTGGEPLIRKDFDEILVRLSSLPVLLTLTTNGVLLDRHIDLLEQCNVNSLNISLDSLDEKKFLSITARNYFSKVMDNIQLLLSRDFHVKINVVVMKRYNDNEIFDFIQWTKEIPIHVRFIEYMPFQDNRWDSTKVYSYKEIIEKAETYFAIEKIKDAPNDTAKNYRVKDYNGTFAVISTMSSPFCSSCNRMRITADGKMKNCLFSKGETDLLHALRSGKPIEHLIRQNLFAKEKSLGGQWNVSYHKLEEDTLVNRSMIQIGG